MASLFGLPLHPALVHFPVAGSVFAAFALIGALLRPAERAAWLNGAVLLLGATVASGLAAAATGWLWADSLAYLPGGALLPGPEVVAGLARRHALLATSGIAAGAVAFGFALRGRKRQDPPYAALAAALLSAALIGGAGHVGGTIVHNPPDPTMAK